MSTLATCHGKSGPVVGDRVTLRDVARLAGVHTSTASRALNEATREVVNAATVERVLDAARRLGYAPDPLARGLRTNRTMSAGMVIPDIENPLFGPIIAGVEEMLDQHGYSLVIADSRDDPAAVVRSLEERRIDGVILATASRQDVVVDDLGRRGVPTVLVNRSSENPLVPAIVGDDHAGIGLAFRHLYELGHRVVGHLAGPLRLSTGLGRYQAYLSWGSSLGVETGEDLVEEAEWFQVEPGYDAARRLLDRRPDVTAVLAANDLIALGAYRAIRERGLAVGPDISVTGYNDIPLLDLLHPPLTSVRVPYRKMGFEAARMLISIIGGSVGDGGGMSVRLAPKLHVRESSAPVRS